MSFADGERRSKLEVVGKVAKTTTGTTVRFWPNPKYFDSAQFSLPRLKHVLRAKAVLCPGLTVKLEVEKPKESETLGLHGRARAISEGVPRRGRLPAGAAVRRQARGQARSRRVGRGLAARRCGSDARELREPDPDAAGRHARQRLADRPDGCAARVLRVPQFAAARHQARARGRLGRRQLRALGEDRGTAVLGADQGAALLARVRHARRRPHQGPLRAVAESAPRDRRRDRAVRDRERAAQAQGGEDGGAQAHRRGPGVARQARGLHDPRAVARRAVPRRGRFGRRLGEAGARSRDPSRHAAARQDPEHVGGRSRRAAGLAGGAQHQHRARRGSGLGQARRLALPQGLHPRGCRFRRAAHRDTVVRAVLEALRAARRSRSRVRRHAAALSHRRRQGSALRARRGRARRDRRSHRSREEGREDHDHALQGLGRDEPVAVARDDDGGRYAAARAARRRRQDRGGGERK